MANDPIVCCVCGSPDWVAASPGDEGGRSTGDGQGVLLFQPAVEVPTLAWCQIHWPWLQGRHAE